MALEISRPTANSSIRSANGAFPVSGRAGESIASVTGVCRSVKHPGLVIEGKTIFYSADPSAGAATRYRWVILFRVPEAGEYRLTVNGNSDSGTLSSASVVFTAELVTARVAGITWPTNDEDITAYADDFTPYGTLVGNPLGSVSLKDSNNNQVTLLYSYGDYTDLDIWTAQFDTVPAVESPVDYTLTVLDSMGLGQEVGGLTVTE